MLSLIIEHDAMETDHVAGVAQSVQGVDFIEELVNYVGAGDLLFHEGTAVNTDFVYKAGEVAVEMDFALFELFAAIEVSEEADGGVADDFLTMSAR